MTLNEAILLAKEGRSAGWGTIVAATFNEKRFLSAKYLSKPLNMVLYKSYVKALSSIKLLNNPNIFSSWLGIIIASISAEDLLKDGSASFEERGIYENENWHEKVLTELDKTPDGVKFTEAEAKEITGNLLKVLATEEKMCVIYRYVEGFSIKEISRALRTTEKAIISLLNSAIKKLEAACIELQKKHKATASFANPVQLLTFALDAEFAFLPKTDVPKNFLAKIIEDTAGVVAKSIYDAKENANHPSDEEDEDEDNDDDEGSIKKGLNKKSIVIIAVIVAVAIGLTVFFINKGNKPAEPSNESSLTSSTVPTSETKPTEESSSEESTEEEGSSEESSSATPVVNQTPNYTGSNSSQNRPQGNTSQNQNSSQSSNNRPSSSQSSNSRPSNSGSSTGNSGSNNNSGNTSSSRPATQPSAPSQTQPTAPPQTQPTDPPSTEPPVEEPDDPQVPDNSEPEEGLPDIE